MTSARDKDDRRRFSRIAFHRPAELRSGAHRARCQLLDVSLKGALVEVPAGFSSGVGDPCTLVIGLGAPDAVIQMDGEIVRLDGSQMAVRCKEIELDSIAHLRRLVELNLGDEQLLHRELSALVGYR